MTDLFQEPLDISDENVDYLQEIAGPGKKFDRTKYESTEAWERAVAEGKYKGDLFAERLKQETAGLRQELNSRVKMEEFLDKLNSFQQPKSPDNGQQPSVTTKEETGLKPEDVLKLLDQREQQSKAVQNVNRVKEHLQETLGPNYATKLKQVASTLNLSEQYLNNLAATSPEAVFKLVDVSGERKQDLFQAPPRNQMATQFRPQGKTLDWAHFEAIKKESPTKYWSIPVQNQMHDLRAKGLLKLPGED